MISKKTAKLIKSLHQKKYRKKNELFLVEGAKSIRELLYSSFTIQYLVATQPFLMAHSPRISSQLTASQVYEVSEKELMGLTTLQSNHAGLAVVKAKKNIPIFPKNEFILALDDVRDPGNLGTIIRIADWYGIPGIVCSNETAEVYNPKVISASMGSFLRVSVYYTDLATYFKSAEVPVYGAFLDGEDVRQIRFTDCGIILMGNESFGINPDLEPWINKKIFIPRFGDAESLNVSIATGIICDNLKRRLTH